MEEILKTWSEVIKVKINECEYIEETNSYVIDIESTSISIRAINRLNMYIEEKGWNLRVIDIWANPDRTICLWVE